MAKLIRVLSIDGGGIIGIAPAAILSEIERVTQQSIAKLFDLITGTSSGGVLALGLVQLGDDGQPGFSGWDGVELLADEGSRILSLSPWHTVRSVWSVEH